MSYHPPLITGPIAPENNPPIHPEWYLPRVFDISAISLGINTTITTSMNHNYVIGQEIRLLVPLTYGAFQLSGRTGFVIAIPALNQVTVNINSVDSNAFVIGTTTTVAQILPIGDINTGTINSHGRFHNGTFIPGSFIDVSPAPFS